jgi:hypothetical protein
MKYEKLYKNSNGEYRYLFNWIGGGFNDVWAKNKRDAINKINSNYTLEVNMSTLRKCTKTQSDKWDRDGYLATC